MVFTDYVGRNDELPITMFVDDLYEDFFVGRPTGACHKHVVLLFECLNYWQLLCLLLYSKYTVEACIAHHIYIVYPDAAEQSFALFVLYEEMSDATQNVRVFFAIPAEENLTGTENATNAIYRHTSMLKDMQIVVPELIFDEERHNGSHKAQKAQRVGNGVDGKIGDDVGTLIVFSHLITRRREEGEQNFIFRMITAYALDEWSPLFKLTKRSSMHPHIFCMRINLFFQRAESLAFAAPHLPYLFVEERCYGYSEEH